MEQIELAIERVSVSMSPASRCQNHEEELAALCDLFHLKQKGWGR